MRLHLVTASVLFLAGLVSAGHPQVSAIYPRGAKRGSEVKLMIYGQRLQTIEGLVFFRKGIEVVECKPDRSNRASVKIRVAADCPLGSHPVLVRTSFGLSNLHLFMVGTLPEVAEKEPNNDTGTAQKVPLETTINGRITSEDLDVFAIAVKKGQRINLEVQALRLGDQEFDAHLTVHDDRGEKLAMVDDTIFGKMDPIAGLTCERDATWFVTIRENARGGSNTSFYRLHVGTFPRPVVAFPAGGRNGKSLVTRLLGDGSAIEAKIPLPERIGFHEHFVTTEQGTSPTPVYLVASGKPNVLEGSLAPKQPAACGISQWHLIGPFANRDKKGKAIGHRTAYAPEKKIELKKDYDGRDGKVAWKEHRELRDNVVHDLRRIVKKSNHSVVYLARFLQAATARRVLCLLSGDDTVRVWLNGKQVLDDAKPSGVVQNQHRLLLDLKQGRNELLVKISNAGGGMGVFCRVLDPLRLTGYGTFPIPSALNGIIQKPQEQDRFVFLARNGEQVDFQAIGRRLRSPVDPSLGVYCTHDRFYVGNDDVAGAGLDSYVRFRAPFTGEFVMTVRDTLATAGPRHVYRVEVSRPAARPLVTRTSLPGYRYEWTVAVPQGGRDAIMINTTYLDQRAGVQLSFAGMPKGVIATIPKFTPGINAVPVVFAAPADAPRAAHLLEVKAAATSKKLDLTNTRFYQQVDIVQARNQQTYLREEIDRLPIAVVKKTPFTLDVAPIPVPIIRNSPLQLKFKLTRAKGYKDNVRVRMLYNPAGISSSQANVPATSNEGSLNLYANNGARIGVHKIVLVAMGNVQGGPVTTSSEVIDLHVSMPWVSASLGTVRTDPGHDVKLPITIKRAKKFGGAVEAQWIGLPRDVKCAPMKIDEKTAKLELPVTIGAKAPPGRHRSFRLRLKVQTDKGWIVQDFRSGEIRIDRPAPPKKPTKKPTPPVKTVPGSKLEPASKGSDS